MYYRGCGGAMCQRSVVRQTHVLCRAQVTILTRASWVVGGLCDWEIYFFDFIQALWLQRGGLCLSRPALSTKWPFQYQLLRANVFCGEFVVKAEPLWVCMSGDWWGLLRLCSRAQTGLDLLGQGRENTILAIAVGAVLIVRLLTTKQQQVQRFNSCYFTLVI